MEEVRNPAVQRQLSLIRKRISDMKERLKGAGERIKRLRLYQDPKSALGVSVTMRDLGTILDMRYQNIPYMESYPNKNFTGVTLEKAVEIAATFNVSLDYLVLGRDITGIHRTPESEDSMVGILKDHIRLLKEENEKLKSENELLRSQLGGH